MNIKQKIFIKKVLIGFKCHVQDTARMFVLTESNEAIAAGYDFVLIFKHLVQYLRRRYGKFEYCCVLHRQGKKERLNYHVIYFGAYVDQHVIEDWWFEHYKSHRSKMELIRSPMREASYLAGYVGNPEKYVGARFSSGWVFPGWWDMGKYYKKEMFKYPPDEFYVKYSMMSEEQLENDLGYSLYLADKIAKGRIKAGSIRRKKRKHIAVFEKILSKSQYVIESVEKN